jgi:hypothetical protein
MKYKLLNSILILCGLQFSCTNEKSNDSSLYDGTEYTLNCSELETLFVTSPVSSSDDWSGYWECFQQHNDCEGPSCNWETSELEEYLITEDCSGASSCEIAGETVQECQSIENTGQVSFYCDSEGEITITANGLPGHTYENYAQSGELPPLLGSSETNMDYTVSTTPIYNSDSDIFDIGGGTIAVAVNGVSIFNQFTGVGTVAVTDEIVDDCGGHPANGTYHYHAFPICGELSSPERKGSSESHSGLVGLSLDGFPVFGPYGYSEALDNTSEIIRMESCYALTSCEDVTDSSCYIFDEEAFENGSCNLDKCNGRVSAVPDQLQAALGEEIYVYHMTLDENEYPSFPYQPYCYRGDAGENSTSSQPPPPPN